MSDIIERNTYLELHDKDGKLERHYPITKFKNIEDVPKADKDNASIVKLYDGAGNQEDGAISQKVTTERLLKVQAALQLLSLNSYIIDDVSGQVYKIGANDGSLYFIKSDVDPKDLADAIVTATEALAFSETTE